jgi:hypothetical protein
MIRGASFYLRDKENFEKHPSTTPGTGRTKREVGLPLGPVTPAARFDVQLIGWWQVGYRIPQIQAAQPPFIHERQHTDQRTMQRLT